MRRVIMLGCLLLLLAGCVPRPAVAPATSGPRGACKTWTAAPPLVGDAILQTFGLYGQTVVDQAGRVSCCESGWVGGDSGSGYLGLFQIGPNMYGTLRFYSEVKFGAGAWVPLDFWVNASTARDSWLGRKGWSAFSCRP